MGKGVDEAVLALWPEVSQGLKERLAREALAPDDPETKIHESAEVLARLLYPELWDPANEPQDAQEPA